MDTPELYSLLFFSCLSSASSFKSFFVAPVVKLVRTDCGAVAQLGERYNGIVEVVGSIPSGSTNIYLLKQ